MPLFDRKCRSCDWLKIDAWEKANDPDYACPVCGGETHRAYLKPPTAIGDEMDHLQVNGLKEPRRFTSKAERRRWLKESGWTEKDSHVPEQGTDKSRFTSNWGSRMDPYTARNVKELIERAFHQSPSTPDPADEPVNIRWVDVNTGK